MINQERCGGREEEGRTELQSVVELFIASVGRWTEGDVRVEGGMPGESKGEKEVVGGRTGEKQGLRV